MPFGVKEKKLSLYEGKNFALQIGPFDRGEEIYFLKGKSFAL